MGWAGGGKGKSDHDKGCEKGNKGGGKSDGWGGLMNMDWSGGGGVLSAVQGVLDALASTMGNTWEAKVDKVKHVTRQDGGKDMWLNFVSSKSNGKGSPTVDPARREEWELDEFLKSASELGFEMEKGKGRGNPNPPSAEKIARVKAVQRSIEGGKEKWLAFIERMGGTKLDPSFRTPEEVDQFLAEADPQGVTVGEAIRAPRKNPAGALQGPDDWWSWMVDPYGAGQQWNDPGKVKQDSKFLAKSQEHADMISRVKAIQKMDKQEGKNNWSDFISPKGGKLDPAARTEEELAEFLAIVDPDCKTASFTGEFDEQGALAAQVKHGQRNSDAFRERWLAFCDSQAGGVKDPSRHSADVLKEFLATAPEVQVVESDEEHRRLVDTIKEGSKIDENYKHAWWKHCESSGSNLMDPAKHEKHMLKVFVDTFTPGMTPPQEGVNIPSGYGSIKAQASDKGKGKKGGKAKAKGKDKGKDKGWGKFPGPYW